MIGIIKKEILFFFAIQMMKALQAVKIIFSKFQKDQHKIIKIIYNIIKKRDNV